MAGALNYLKGAQASQSANAGATAAAIAAAAPALYGLTAVGVDTSIGRVTCLQLVCDHAETPGYKVARRYCAARVARDFPRITRSLSENLAEHRNRNRTAGFGFKEGRSSFGKIDCAEYPIAQIFSFLAGARRERTIGGANEF